MTYVVRSTANLPRPRGWTVARPAHISQKPKRLDIVTRRYDVCWLNGDDAVENRTVVAPAMDVFEQAFAALAQGTLIQTDKGQVAVEDLRPGDMIATADQGLRKLRWVGSMTLFPGSSDLGLPSAQLFRFTDGSYGHERGSPDLMLGPSARILPGILATDSSSSLLQPADLEDGQSVIRITPVSQVRVFHLALDRQGLMRANGILVASYHPGPNIEARMAPELFPHFLGLFPHVSRISDFGPLKHAGRE